ncbi:MAG: pantothenate kinase [Candidatus Methanoplasma sp.]|jgi:pantoate kinase|nr:pantothenate kinase [Candidatus Methanoplasma sp.]
MISAFCPAHISCFFKPSDSEDILRKGSSGAGIRLSSGTRTSIEETDGKTSVTIDGAPFDAGITRLVLERLAPGKTFSVEIDNALPMGQGFGMSASGAVSTALCVAELMGIKKDEAFRAAHAADIIGGGGLGDVAGLLNETHQPTRTAAGLPPVGKMAYSGLSFSKLTVAVLGPKVSTASVLGDPVKYKLVQDKGGNALNDFLHSMTVEDLFYVSNRFSSSVGVECPEVSAAIRRLRSDGIRSAMCMLGNSLFIDAGESEVRKTLGDDVYLRTVASTAEPARVIRKG